LEGIGKDNTESCKVTGDGKLADANQEANAESLDPQTKDQETANPVESLNHAGNENKQSGTKRAKGKSM
jgi:hypothetical protein